MALAPRLVLVALVVAVAYGKRRRLGEANLGRVEEVVDVAKVVGHGPGPGDSAEETATSDPETPSGDFIGNESATDFADAPASPRSIQDAGSSPSEPLSKEMDLVFHSARPLRHLLGENKYSHGIAEQVMKWVDEYGLDAANWLPLRALKCADSTGRDLMGTDNQTGAEVQYPVKMTLEMVDKTTLPAGKGGLGATLPGVQGAPPAGYGYPGGYQASYPYPGTYPGQISGNQSQGALGYPMYQNGYPVGGQGGYQAGYPPLGYPPGYPAPPGQQGPQAGQTGGAPFGVEGDELVAVTGLVVTLGHVIPIVAPWIAGGIVMLR